MAAKKVKTSKTALITGPTSGIGKELAKVFANHRYHLILVGRSHSKLLSVKNEIHKKHKNRIDLIVQDLSEPNAAQLIFEKVQKSKIQIEVLVNNAGFATSGKFAETALEPELAEIQVNIIALTSLTKLFATDMKKRGIGKILNVASTAAFFPGPLMSVYYATKAYVLSFSLGLAEELKKSGIQVSVLCPGPTETEFAQKAGTSNNRLFRSTRMSPKQVAEAAYQGLVKTETIIIPGTGNQAMVFLSRFVPRDFQAKLVQFAHLPK